MNEYQRKYQYLSQLVAALPEGISPARYIACFQEAVRQGEVAAVPIGSSFKVGKQVFKDDMVRAGSEFDEWHERAVRSLGLYRQRRGVAAHETDVVNGAVDFDELAERYRQQLLGRASVKKPRHQTKRGKPKLIPTRPDDRMAAQPAPGSSSAASEQGGGGDVEATAEAVPGQVEAGRDDAPVAGV